MSIKNIFSKEKPEETSIRYVLKLFGVRDRKMNRFINIFTQETVDQALRGFEQAANDSRSDISNFSVDFELFQIGTFDTFTGNGHFFDHAISLGLAHDFKKQSPGLDRKLPLGTLTSVDLDSMRSEAELQRQ